MSTLTLVTQLTSSSPRRGCVNGQRLRKKSSTSRNRQVPPVNALPCYGTAVSAEGCWGPISRFCGHGLGFMGQRGGFIRIPIIIPSLSRARVLKEEARILFRVEVLFIYFSVLAWIAELHFRRGRGERGRSIVLGTVDRSARNESPSLILKS